MRGKRAKALRREFLAAYGRPPQDAQWTRNTTGWMVKVSESRVWKKLFKELKGENRWPSSRQSR
jgi:hypothetical protein